jgi:hypothetical protein
VESVVRSLAEYLTFVADGVEAVDADDTYG